ncbi:magnesium/cobalt efflux protein [Candidatus Tenderia electrophaga]|jgi:magnesium and cobalt transporter|uniref:Magnesium and cobalt efflux protein CorC n=1 Tax=Candidatus Tenderia electrophaga TaxID=1748243 RepID=A0A0S2TA23_9GAMM|nr:magnesium/cobalt efflux protein [Candidatus Tenderia electrophaga]
MNEDRSSSSPTSRSWLERLGQVLSGEPKDRFELIELLRDAQQRQLLDIDALAMMEGVMQVSEMQVREIMIPRAQMVVVQQDMALDEILPVITESGHSRFPVIGENRDQVVGLILAKDLLPYFIAENDEDFSVRDVLRPAVFVPESKRLNVLLKDFRANRNHMAVVVDEFGGAAGLVTIEDVVEQIVGEIADEHDIEEDIHIKRQNDNRYIIKALTPIEDFNQYFGAEFSDEEFDTMGGLVMQAFGRMPVRGEIVSIDQYRFKVLSADSRRIYLLEVNIVSEQQHEIPQPMAQDQGG